MPFTRGSSGPTNTKSILFSSENFPIPLKSVALISTFSPYCAVPALPCAINSLLQLGLWAIFQAKALSLPPEPRSRIFMRANVKYNVQNFDVQISNVQICKYLRASLLKFICTFGYLYICTLLL